MSHRYHLKLYICIILSDTLFYMKLIETSEQT